MFFFTVYFSGSSPLVRDAALEGFLYKRQCSAIEENKRSMGDLAKSLGDLLSAFEAFSERTAMRCRLIRVAAAPPPPCSASRGVASCDAPSLGRQVQA